MTEAQMNLRISEFCNSFYHMWKGPAIGILWEPSKEQLCLCGCVRWDEKDLPRLSGYKTIRPTA